MSERQDVRPLSTEDLLPDDRARADEARADDTYEAQHADDRADEAQQVDDRTDTYDSRSEGQYDETPAVTEQYDQQPVAEQQRPTADEDESSEPLFTGEEVNRFRGEWRELQSDFVDHPRDAVQHADELVAQVMQSLATTFADHKRSLEGQWSAGEQVETEELRVALRRYRAFFDQLLTV
jgi:hypothetical protein